MNLRTRLSLDSLEERWTPDAASDAATAAALAAAAVVTSSSIAPSFSPPITIITNSGTGYLPPISTSP
jgi:hypothetical protein